MLSRILKIVGLICLSLGAMLFVLVWALGPHQPSDEALEKRFYRQRADLDRLVAMMDQDRNMSRVAPDFSWSQDSAAWPRPESEWGISRQRWDDYRKIFSRTGFKEGTVRREKSSDVMVLVWAWGIVPAGVSVSFLHCGAPGDGYNHTEAPCTRNEDSGQSMYGKSSSFGYRFKKITEGWYILEESN